MFFTLLIRVEPKKGTSLVRNVPFLLTSIG